MPIATWLFVAVHLLIGGALLAAGSVAIRWLLSDRRPILVPAIALCVSVAMMLLVGAIGLSFAHTDVWATVLPVRALLVGLTTASLLATLARIVPLPAIRPAIAVSIALPSAFAVVSLLGGPTYRLDPSSWPVFLPLGDVIAGASVALLAGYLGIAVRRRRTVAMGRSLAFAAAAAAAVIAVGLASPPGLLRESMTTLWSVPVAVVILAWGSGEVVLLQGSLVSAVAERVKAERTALWRTQHDTLTGLPNREALELELTHRFEAAADSTADLLVVAVRVEWAETVDPETDPAAATSIVTTMIAAATALIPPGAILARTGHTTFMVGLTRRDPEMATAEIDSLVARAVTHVRTATGVPADLRIVAGIATSATAASARDLIRHAEVAVAAARQDGLLVRHYCPELGRLVAQRVEMLRRLHEAVGRGEIEVLYQPIVDAGSLRRVGVEALARWRQDGRLATPAEWLPLAAAHGLLPSIGFEVFRIAARDQAALQCPVAVNVSADALTAPGFVEDVLAALDECPPAAVVLEVTENAAVEDLDLARHALQRLRAYGMRVAIDDFGVEHSSLSRLAALPFDILKIDRSFVERVATPDGAALVRAVHSMAKALGKTTVAEGVETAEQLAALTAIGCDRIQGFLTGRPETLEYLTPLVRTA